MNKLPLSHLAIATLLCLSPGLKAENIEFPRTVGSQGCLIEQLTDGPFGQYQFQGVSRDGNWLSFNISESDEGPYHGRMLNLQSGKVEKLDSVFNNTGNFSQDNSTLVAAVFDRAVHRLA